MSRTEIRCDAARADIMLAGSSEGKCGKLLTRSPQLGERVQLAQPNEVTGVVWLVDHNRHLACFHVETVDGIKQDGPAKSETAAWTALRPCNGEPIR